MKENRIKEVHRRKMCPLLGLGFMVNQPDIGWECHEDECAWWTGDDLGNYGCAVTWIAAYLFGIKNGFLLGDFTIPIRQEEK